METETVTLTAEQIRSLQELLDGVLYEPDFFWDDENKVVFQWKGTKKVCMSLQVYLNRYLYRDKFHYSEKE